MARVIRVYGRADSYDIEFTPKEDKWEVDVPPDMTDGVYAVQLTAVDEIGDFSYWVGELYMVDGVCCLKIEETPYRVRLKVKEYEAECEGRYDISHQPSHFDVDYKDKYAFTHHSSSYEVDYDDRYDVVFKKVIRPSYDAAFVKRLDVTERATRYEVTFKAKQTETKTETEFNTRHTPKTEFLSKFTPRTEFLIRKGCQCYGGR